MTDTEIAGQCEERRRVAVLLALRTGLLRECPIHGDLYDTGRHDFQGALMVASFLINQSDPLVAPFGGDRAGVGESLKEVCRSYAADCPRCSPAPA
jgi:hypothetical protein